MKKYLLNAVALATTFCIGGCTPFSQKIEPNSDRQMTQPKVIQNSDFDKNKKILPKNSRYYTGIVGTKKARLVYWPVTSEENNNHSFFEGLLIYDDTQNESKSLKIQFTSGGRFIASSLPQDEKNELAEKFESTDECDGKNEEGILCGAWSNSLKNEVFNFSFKKTEPFLINTF
jgi:hypothetical protein